MSDDVVDDDRIADDGPDAPLPEDLTPPVDVEACGERALPEQPLRRLSSLQYHNTIRDLFGEELAAPLLEGSLFPETIIDSGFSGDAEANVVNTAESNAIEDNAERIATQIQADPQAYLAALMPCELSDPATEAEVDGCIGDFISEFGTKAYRRPLTQSETELAQRVFDAVRAEQTAIEAWTATVQYFVQAPATLYRVERGIESPLPGLVQISSYEMATRLSYLVLGSMPDADLFEAAAADELQTSEQIIAQAERLMDSRQFAQAFGQFHRDWLHLYELDNLSKDQELFPEFTPELRPSLQREASELALQVFARGGNVEELLSTNQLPMDATLAAFYGVDAPADDWDPVEVDDRRGILTQASFMAALAEPNRTNPIHRGAFFQTQILCNQLPAIPGNVDTQGPLEDTSDLPTARERLSPLLERGECLGCHQMINPIGLAFENYDAAGQWRAEENGSQIDAAGSFDFGDGPVEFETSLELMQAASQSERVRQCYSLQWYRAALGRKEFAEDACSRAVVDSIATESGGDLKQILLAVVQSDGFRFRKAVEE